ncbi:MAG: heavy-metal-associated domain-containing protein [Eubacterium sp.]|nr:heavy-metal-associated domain-containing protein [Eubacterium sp.]
MNKITLKIDGMMCGMCEAHINDTIRKIYPGAKKVASSRKKGETTFLLDETPDEEKIKAAITETGYEFKGIKTEPFVKKGLFKR